MLWQKSLGRPSTNRLESWDNEELFNKPWAWSIFPCEVSKSKMIGRQINSYENSFWFTYVKTSIEFKSLTSFYSISRFWL